MKIILISNLLTPHQHPLCEAFANMEEVNEFYFIETVSRDNIHLPIGWQFKGEFLPYLVTVEEYGKSSAYWQEKIFSADAVIIGSAPDELITARKKAKKMIFRYSERPLKKGIEPLKFVPRLIKWHLKNTPQSNIYMLCASAYTAADYAKFGLFRGKCYKWGYFPEVKIYENIDSVIEVKQSAMLLWVARLIDWKHPEIAVSVAKKLKEDGYHFKLNMIGSGEMHDAVKRMIADNMLDDCVDMLGEMKGEDVRAYMEKSQMFLFTSDRQEGWGAVLNEAMNSGCAVVANRAIGSVPYLLRHGENGLIYDTEEELYQSVKMLLDHPELPKKLGIAAYQTMADTWNAEVAAERLLRLCEKIKEKGECDLFADGPCSREG